MLNFSALNQPHATRASCWMIQYVPALSALDKLAACKSKDSSNDDTQQDLIAPDKVEPFSHSNTCRRLFDKKKAKKKEGKSHAVVDA